MLQFPPAEPDTQSLRQANGRLNLDALNRQMADILVQGNNEEPGPSRLKGWLVKNFIHSPIEIVQDFARIFIPRCLRQAFRRAHHAEMPVSSTTQGIADAILATNRFRDPREDMPNAYVVEAHSPRQEI